MPRTLLLWTILAVLGAADTSRPQTGEESGLAEQAYTILKNRCYRCHGGAQKDGGLDVLSREVLVHARSEGESRPAFVVPGKPEESQLIDVLEGGDDSYMPLDNSPERAEMTEEEKQLIVRWVEEGAEFPVLRSIKFVGEAQMLRGMRAHLLKVNADDRRYIRFYTLAHLYNNPTVSGLDLRHTRAALSKAINSLTKRREVFLPRAVEGTEDTVYAVDLRELGWNRADLWGVVTSHYPYGMSYDFVDNKTLSQLWKDVSQLSGADLPYLRADWFVVTATRPPLYHDLLGIPKTLAELEQEMQLDLQANFLHADLHRAGFTKSGVSQQNRLLERHTSPVTRYFWISYDFLPRQARGDLTRFPLGPRFRQNPFNNQAFEHDGGEIIWSLPNGMQAYMLLDSKGNRIGAGPIDVVFDKKLRLGTPQITNGISCMSCHAHGMISGFRDELRNAGTLGGAARDHLREIYPPHEEMSRLTAQDAAGFLRALQRVAGPYLRVGEDADKDISSFSESIGRVAVRYARDLTPLEMALELGFADPEELQRSIASDRELLRFGLGNMTLDPPGTLKRDKWEAREGTSMMQHTASKLRIGLPLLPAHD